MFDDYMDELYLSTRDLSGVAALCEAVSSPDCALATLDISGIDLGDDGASLMAKAIAASKLTSLKCANNGVSEAAAGELKAAVAGSAVELSL